MNPTDKLAKLARSLDTQRISRHLAGRLSKPSRAVQSRRWEPNIVVFGAGVVGGSVGGWLAPHYKNLTFIDQGAVAEALKENGLTLYPQSNPEVREQSLLYLRFNPPQAAREMKALDVPDLRQAAPTSA